MEFSRGACESKDSADQRRTTFCPEALLLRRRLHSIDPGQSDLAGSWHFEFGLWCSNLCFSHMPDGRHLFRHSFPGFELAASSMLRACGAPPSGVGRWVQTGFNLKGSTLRLTSTLSLPGYRLPGHYFDSAMFARGAVSRAEERAVFCKQEGPPSPTIFSSFDWIPFCSRIPHRGGLRWSDFLQAQERPLLSYSSHLLLPIWRS
jgi:hypothetical protein